MPRYVVFAAPAQTGTPMRVEGVVVDDTTGQKAVEKVAGHGFLDAGDTYATDLAAAEAFTVEARFRVTAKP